MGDPTRISYLPLPDRDEVPDGVARLWDKSQEAFGFVPNVFRAQAVNGEQFLAWWGYFNLLVNKEGHLTNADRELLAVVVSSVNRCTYCEISHGAALRTFTEDAVRADLVASNWRQAGLPEREAAMCAYAEKLTLHPAEVTESDLEPLRAVGLDDHQIVELVQVVGMFNLTNRVSTALGFVPNAEYHEVGRP
ncbi:putative peroxidase-related enzyme [Humibacillus xanthopallidus]|uniref:Putative peroxidase-related enzyme n=1 Tax=Humibacillus xanthopallidus TaxID=412689 RepID=A0A543PWA3_9MICO|nr:peroxidase-related enzyme [Humibacillus xanthopallidus]TQN48361.1 putative peroxidase-related enzyme [Humibacillus xanthopallidus]